MESFNNLVIFLQILCIKFSQFCHFFQEENIVLDLICINFYIYLVRWENKQVFAEKFSFISKKTKSYA